MSSEDCGCQPQTHHLYRDFFKHEVETVEDLLSCMAGPATNANWRRIFLLMLRGHYSNPENYGDDFPNLKCYQWAPDGTTVPGRKLTIDFTGKFDDTNPDNYPGIFVGFGGTQLAKLAIGNEAGHSDDRSRKHLSKGARLTLKIIHVTQGDMDAYDMAELSQCFFQALAPVIAEKTGAMSVEVAGYGDKESVSGAPDRYYKVVLSIEINYTAAVALSLESHRIRRIAIQVQPEAART